MERKSLAPHFPVYPAHALEVVGAQILQADGGEEVLLPALDAAVDAPGHEALLADDAAEAAGLAAGGHVGQGVCQVVELALVEELLGHVVLEPEGLWDLHLDGHLAADVTQHVVARGVDLLGLLLGPVVKPEDDVAVLAVLVGEVRPCHAHGLVRLPVEDGERAGGIEADAAD